nr:hypothetical protein [uncultured Dorea sp.]
MQSWEEKVLIRQEGIAEGKKLGYEEGKKELLKNLVSKKLAKNISTEQIAEILEIDISEVENITKELAK